MPFSDKLTENPYTINPAGVYQDKTIYSIKVNFFYSDILQYLSINTDKLTYFLGYR
ncbi:unnamed protein product, partial [marine sediment metagenome]